MRLYRSACATALLIACRSEAPPAQRIVPSEAVRQPALGDNAKVEFVTDPFDRYYDLFLRRTIPAGEKATIWNSYRGRWVRWSGLIASFSRDGITVRMRPLTATFDVSLRLTVADRTAALARYHVKDWVTFIGRLESYDDIFRNIYLGNGQIVGKTSAPADGGFN